MFKFDHLTNELKSDYRTEMIVRLYQSQDQTESNLNYYGKYPDVRIILCLFSVGFFSKVVGCVQSID